MKMFLRIFKTLEKTISRNLWLKIPIFNKSSEFLYFFLKYIKFIVDFLIHIFKFPHVFQNEFHQFES